MRWSGVLGLAARRASSRLGSIAGTEGLKDYYRRLRAGTDEERRKVVVVLYAVVALVALVGVSISSISGLSGDDGSAVQMLLVPRLGPTASEVGGFILLGAAVVAGGLTFVYLQERIRRQAEAEKGLQRFRIPRAVILFITAPLVVACVFIVFLSVVSQNRQDSLSYAEKLTAKLEEVDRQAERGELPSVEEIERRQVARQRRPFFLLGTIVALFAAVAIFGGRLLREAPEALEDSSPITEELKRDLAHATGLAIDDIAAEPNHRRAVEMCYSRVGEVLDAHGFPHPLHQTPVEYMHSVLDAGPGLPARELLELTGLFEVAKFSTHHIGPDRRDQALDLLRSIHRILLAQLAQAEGEASEARAT